MRYEKITKHQAIEKAKVRILDGSLAESSQKPSDVTWQDLKPKKESINGNPSKTKALSEIDQMKRSVVLTKMYSSFKKGLQSSTPARDYVKSRHLDHLLASSGKTTCPGTGPGSGLGYNSGQFHHGSRRDRHLIKSCLEVGLLIDRGRKSRTGEPAYQSFGKGGIVFPLKDKSGHIVSLYFRSITDNKNQLHYYLRDRQGLYPSYPAANTRKLILTESVIDAATLLQQQAITRDFEILALYGTNGLTKEHTKCLSGLPDLEEIVLFFDGDHAGRGASKKYVELFKQSLPGLKCSVVDTPEGEDINSLLDGHSPEILLELLERRQSFIFSLKLAAR